MVVCFRMHGERLLPAGRSNPRKLKSLFQEAGVVPWMRDRLPLLRRDGELVAIANLWVAAGAADAFAGQRLELEWQDAPPVR